MVNFLLDTNIISGYISNKYDEEKMTIISKIIEINCNISIISKIEILSWKTQRSTEDLLREFVDLSNVISLSDEICETAISIRRTRSIRTPDAIIAATALNNSLTIITENEKDFAHIKNLKVIHPKNLKQQSSI